MLGGYAVSFFCHPVQISCGAHPAVCPIDINVSFCGVKWPERDAKLSTPSNSEGMLKQFLQKKRGAVPVVGIFSSEILIGPPF
jgi:hypothetical protein